MSLFKWSQRLRRADPPGDMGGEVNEPEHPASPSRDERLRHFDSEIYGRVEGWLGERMSQMIAIIGEIFDAHQVRGNIAEFGVHHGRFLFLLNALRNDDEECFAIDVFDAQHLNIDHSGSGSLAAFCSHLEALMGPQRRFFKIIESDTTSFSVPAMTDLFGNKGVKFLSIDAGHTVQHAVNDLTLAQEIIVAGGVIALDDYMSVHWPGVTEGFYRFMAAGNRRLKPFMFFQNKLFLTTLSEHSAYFRQFRSAIEERYSEELRSGRWREVKIAEADCLTFF